MEKNLDLRIVKTYTALTEALKSLLIEKSFSDITVSEICDKAMVRRATFYKHFGDKNELLVFMFKEMRTEIKKQQDETRHSDPECKRDFYCDNLVMLEYIETHEDLFRALNNACSVTCVYNLVADSITRNIKEYLMQGGSVADPHSLSSALLYQLLTGAFLSGITWWLNHRELFTKYEMAEQLTAFVINTVRSGGISLKASPDLKLQ